MHEGVDILDHVMPPSFESVGTYSLEEFLQFVRERESQGDVHHYELLHGRIVMNPPAGWPHGNVEGKLVTWLNLHVGHRKLGLVFGASQGFRLGRHVVEPDVSFVSGERWQAMPELPKPGEWPAVAPDLVMEILSPSNAFRDRGAKREIYEQAVVREYWLVDPAALRVTVLVHDGTRFRESAVVEHDGSAESHVLPGFRAPLAELFSGT